MKTRTDSFQELEVEGKERMLELARKSSRFKEEFENILFVPMIKGHK
jgi:hypothetical protein